MIKELVAKGTSLESMHGFESAVLERLSQQSRTSGVVLEGMPWYITPSSQFPAQDYTSQRFLAGGIIQQRLAVLLDQYGIPVCQSHMIDDVHQYRPSSFAEGHLDSNPLTALGCLSDLPVMNVGENDFVALESDFAALDGNLCSQLDGNFQLHKLRHILMLLGRNGEKALSEISLILVHPAEFQSQQNMMLQDLSKAIRDPRSGLGLTASKNQSRELLCEIYTHVWITPDGQIIVTSPRFVDGHFVFEPIQVKQEYASV